MRSVTPMRAAKTGYIIMSVLLCVLGVVLFVWPGVSVAVIGELLGIGMIVFGAVKVRGICPVTCSGWPSSTIWPSACC